MAKGQCNEKMAIYYPKGRGTTPQFREARIIDPKVGNISLLATLGGFLNNKKRIFGPTKTLFGQTYKWPFLRISGRDHVLCHCGSFFMAQTVPPSLVNQSPKIRVLILAKLEWPEMAKNRGEPWKMTHSPVNFFNTKEVSHWFPDIRVPKVLLSPPKKWISIVNFQMFFQLV